MFTPPPPPPAEVPITRELVRALLAEQHPDLVDLDLADPIEGFDMGIVRIGGGLAARLPRHRGSVASLEAEITWVGRLQDAWTFPTQRIVRVCEPGPGYPWRWAITSWLEGELAANRPLDASEAPVLGMALAQIHRPAPADAPFNSDQSIPLAEREPALRAVLPDLPDVARRRGLAFDTDAAWVLWRHAMAVPDAATWVWVHGDLHPFNVISRDGRFAGIIDWSDISGADPAADLGYLWLLLPADALPAAHDAYGGVDEATAARAAGIALAKAATLAVVDVPIVADVGWRALVGLGVAR